MIGLVVVAAVLLFAWADVPMIAQEVLSTATIAAGYWMSWRAVEVRLALAFLSVATMLRDLLWR